MYDAASLQRAFSAAGFAEVKQMTYLESRICDIDTIEDGGRILNGEGIVVEGIKA